MARAFGSVLLSRRADRGPGRPTPIAEALRHVLKASGLEKDVARAAVLAAWPTHVGTQIASVTQPRLLAEDGTLVVGVRTHAWMTELALMERSLLERVNAGEGSVRVRRIRWELLR